MFSLTWHNLRELCQHQVNSQCGDDQAEQSTAEREKHAFRQQLPHYAHPARSQGRTNGKLARPCCRARQQQVRDIRAGDQQNNPYRSQQQQEVEPTSPTIDCLSGSILVPRLRFASG